MEAAGGVFRVDYVLALGYPMVAFSFLGPHRFPAERHFVRFQNLAVAHQRHGVMVRADFSTTIRSTCFANGAVVLSVPWLAAHPTLRISNAGTMQDFFTCRTMGRSASP